MTLDEATPLVTRLIFTEEVHRDYQRTVDLADVYRRYITGMGIEKLLKQFVRREDKTMFEQRVSITRSVTPAVASSIRQPFNKVARNDRIRKNIGIKEENPAAARVNGMIKGFFGSPKKKNKGLDYWMKTRFVDLQAIDPNSWIILEWDPVTSSQVIKPRPFEVNAAQARHFRIVNDEIKWLFVEENVVYRAAEETVVTGAVGEGTGLPGQTYVTGTPAVSNPNNAPGVITPPLATKTGKRYTLYDEQITLVYQQIDPDAYEMKPGETQVKIKEAFYTVRTFTPNIGYPPAFRIGYKRDDSTDGRTFVNIWHDALCFFEKSLKTVSELDLTMTLHAFPQKLQYVQQCIGAPKKPCNKGVLQDGVTACGVCKGTGYKLHTTAQDAILMPMPDTKEDQLDLDKLLIYKSPPIDIIKFQNDYTQQMERQAHQAVYNSQVFVKKSTSATQTSGGGIQTATEADFNMQSVYDALEPFTEKFSEIWRDFVTTFGILAGLKIDDIDAVHDFPADYKLKTDDILLAERQVATNSGAAQFIIENIDDDLADIIFAGDILALQRYRITRRYYPFSGNTPDEIAMLVTSQYVPEESKILYSNFNLIFKNLEKQYPDFFTKVDPTGQDGKVAAEVKKIQEQVKSQQAAITLNTLRNSNPTAPTNNGSTGGHNSGSNSNPTDEGTVLDPGT
jgi:hypothetical protein